DTCRALQHLEHTVGMSLAWPLPVGRDQPMLRPLFGLMARLVSSVSLTVMPIAAGVSVNAALLGLAAAQAERSSSADCGLQSDHGRIKHLIWLQFDNVHFTRDSLNVPS